MALSTQKQAALRPLRAALMAALSLPRGSLGGLEAYTRTVLYKLLRELSPEELLEAADGRVPARLTPAVLQIAFDPRKVPAAAEALEAEAAASGPAPSTPVNAAAAAEPAPSTPVNAAAEAPAPSTPVNAAAAEPATTRSFRDCEVHLMVKNRWLALNRARLKARCITAQPGLPKHVLERRWRHMGCHYFKNFVQRDSQIYQDLKNAVLCGMGQVRKRLMNGQFTFSDPCRDLDDFCSKAFVSTTTKKLERKQARLRKLFGQAFEHEASSRFNACTAAQKKLLKVIASSACRRLGWGWVRSSTGAGLLMTKRLVQKASLSEASLVLHQGKAKGWRKVNKELGVGYLFALVFF